MSRFNARRAGRLSAVGVLLTALFVVAASAIDFRTRDEIQTAFDKRSKSLGVTTDLAAGDILVTEPMTLDTVMGGVVQGKGVHTVIGYTHELATTATRLIAYGANRTTMTMLTLNGSSTVFRDFAMFGRNNVEQTNGDPYGARGVLVTKVAEGLGTGDFLFHNMAFDGFETAVQFAEGVVEGNTERSKFDKVRFLHCDRGLQLNSQQSMGFTVTGCEFYNVNECIRVQGGGKLYAFDVYVHHPPPVGDEEFCVLHLAPTDYRFSAGPNADGFHLYGVYADQVAPNLKLLKMEPLDSNDVRVGYYSNVVFEGFHISYETYTEPAVEIAGVSSTTLRDGYGVQDAWVRWDNNPTAPDKFTSRLVIENCCVFDCTTAADMLDVAGSRGDCHVTVRNCYTDNNVPIADFTGVVTGALP